MAAAKQRLKIQRRRLQIRKWSLLVSVGGTLKVTFKEPVLLENAIRTWEETVENMFEATVTKTPGHTVEIFEEGKSH